MNDELDRIADQIIAHIGTLRPEDPMPRYHAWEDLVTVPLPGRGLGQWLSARRPDVGCFAREHGAARQAAIIEAASKAETVEAMAAVAERFGVSLGRVRDLRADVGLGRGKAWRKA